MDDFRSVAPVDRREGGGGGSLWVVLGTTGLEGVSSSLSVESFEEPLLVKPGLLDACMLFRRASGGAGGVLLWTSVSAVGELGSLVVLRSVVGDVNPDGSELTWRLLGIERELIKLSNVGVGPLSPLESLRGFPRRLFGGGGFFLVSDADPMVARCSFAWCSSKSSEVRGLASGSGTTVSKIECCEIEAVSALEPLSLTVGMTPVWVFCTAASAAADDGVPRSPVSNNLLKASTSMAAFVDPLRSLPIELPEGPPTGGFSLVGLRGTPANRPSVSRTASCSGLFKDVEVDTVIEVLTLAFSNATSMTRSSSPSEVSLAKGSIPKA